MNLNIYVNGGNYSPPQKKEIHVSMTYDEMLSFLWRKIRRKLQFMIRDWKQYEQ